MTTVLFGPPVRGRSRRFAVRSAVLLVVGATSVAGLSACSSADPVAIRVGDFTMSRADFETELQSAAKNTQVTEQLGGAQLADKKWNPPFVADTLNNVMIWQAIEDEVQEKKVAVKPTEAAIKERIIQAYGGEKPFATLPKSFRDRQFSLSSQVNALIEAQVATLGSPEDYFAKHKADFPGEVCASHILVATAAEAEAAKKRIDGGEDFAKVADALTQDPGGKGQGGTLGCAAPSSYVAEFAAAVSTLEVGKVSDPVQTQFGFHVIKVTKRQEATFASSKDAITSALQQQGSLAAQKSVFGRLTRGTVSVDPSLGSIDDSGQFLQITAPKLKVEPKPTTAPVVSVQP